MELNRLNLVFPILVVALILSLFGCGGTSSTPSEGVFGSQWGTEGSGEGEFNTPGGIAIASDGSVYVADTNNHRIQKFTSEGVFVSKWGTEGSGDGELQAPNDVAVASDGSVYVADSKNNRIQKFAAGP
jgi:DNA-binding beta-propeller fold protein YncE